MIDHTKSKVESGFGIQANTWKVFSDASTAPCSTEAETYREYSKQSPEKMFCKALEIFVAIITSGYSQHYSHRFEYSRQRRGVVERAHNHSDFDAN